MRSKSFIFIMVLFLLTLSLMCAGCTNLLSSPSTPTSSSDFIPITAMQGFYYAMNTTLAHYEDIKIEGIYNDGFPVINTTTDAWLSSQINNMRNTSLPDTLNNTSDDTVSAVFNGTSYSWDYFLIGFLDNNSTDKVTTFMIEVSSSEVNIEDQSTFSPGSDILKKMQGLHSFTDWKCDSDAATGIALSLYHNITDLDPTCYSYTLEDQQNSTAGNDEFDWVIALYGENHPIPYGDGGFASNYSNTLFTHVDAETGSLLYYNYSNFYIPIDN